MTAVTAGAAAGQSGGGSSKEALTASDVGISPTEIHIGVIADTGSSLAPGLFQGSVDGVQAWAKYMNEKEGGLAGRKIVVDTYDSALDANKARNSVIEACSKDFAIIGTSALFLNNVDDLVSCKDIKGAATGLPDVPFTTTEVVHQCSPVSYPINPSVLDCATKDQHPQSYRGPLGATNYYLKKFGKNASTACSSTRPTSSRRRTRRCPRSPGSSRRGSSRTRPSTSRPGRSSRTTRRPRSRSRTTRRPTHVTVATRRG